MKNPDFNRRFSISTSVSWIALWSLTMLYRLVNTIWRWKWNPGTKKGYRPGIPVISVGNITVGGTGKTPVTGALLDFFLERNIRVSVLTRGYKSEYQGETLILPDMWKEAPDWKKYGDEPVMLSFRHPESRILISPDRVASARMGEADADLFILDDGMQHLKLERDLNLVLVDATQVFGNGWMLPLGPLREPLSQLQRADAVLLTKTNLKNAEDLTGIIRHYIGDQIPVFESEYRFENLKSSAGNLLPASDLKGKTTILFSGIGNPKGFEKTIESVGGIVKEHLVFADHQEYDTTKVQFIQEALSNSGQDELLITTEKDSVKLNNLQTELPEFWYAQMEVQLPDGFYQFLSEWYKQKMS